MIFSNNCFLRPTNGFVKHGVTEILDKLSVDESKF